MTQILALDWDTTQVRYVLANATGTRFKIRALGSRSVAEGPADDQLSQLGQALREELAGKCGRRCAVLVGLSRNDVELMNLTLPPAEDRELPELVAPSVLRQSPHLGEEAIIDFLPLTADADQPRLVSAAICPEELRKRTVRVCEQAGLTPTRLLLRPYALASWAQVPEIKTAQAVLLACRVHEELDLALVVDAKVVYSRTVRLPRHQEEISLQARWLAEISRTLLVAPQSLTAAQTIERIVVIGEPESFGAVTERMEHELGLPVTIVNPLAGVAARNDAVEDVAAFAPLVGMLQDEVRQQHALDFLHPRRPPAPPNRRRQMTVAGVVLAAIAAVLGFKVWDTLRVIDEQNETLSSRLRELDESLKKAARQRQVVAAVEEWQAGSVNWLDELRDICNRFPTSRDAVVLRLALNPSRVGEGEIDLNGLVRDPNIVRRMENAIRDDYHQMRSPRVQERVQEKNYSWHFESRVLVKPRSRNEYLAHFRGEKAAPKVVPREGPRAGTVPVAASGPALSTERSERKGDKANE